MPVTSGDRVLIHLMELRMGEGGLENYSDQDMISSRCGIGRTHITRILKPLVSEGLVDERSGRMPGRPRKVKLYSLTAKGWMEATSLRKRIMSMNMRWIDENGREHEGRLERCLSEINSHLTKKSMKALPLSLLMSLPIDKLTWNDILWTSTSMGVSEREIILLEGWRSVEYRSPFERSPFSAALMGRIDEMMGGSDPLIITGPQGSGKKDLIWHWSRSRRKKILFLERAEGEVARIEGEPFEVLVLIGGADPEPGDLLMGVMSPADPRDEGWPEELSNAKLILTTEFEGELKGKVLRTDGASREHFIRICLEKGLDEELAGMLYDASRGSTRVLHHVIRMETGDIDELRDRSREEAVISLIASSRERE